MAQVLKKKQKWMLLKTSRFTTLCVVSRNNLVLKVINQQCFQIPVLCEKKKSNEKFVEFIQKLVFFSYNMEAMLFCLLYGAERLTARNYSALEVVTDCKRSPLKNHGEVLLPCGLAVEVVSVESFGDHRIMES